MSGNVSPTEDSELTPKQEQLIAALVTGCPIVTAAQSTGISEKTAHRWLKQPAFQRVYELAKQAIFDEDLRELRESKRLVREMLLKHIKAEIEVTPASQIQAARVLLERFIIAEELAELREQQKTILEKLKEMGVKV